jgi:hypothetical protein
MMHLETVLLSAATLLLAASGAQAAECRATTSVDASAASVAANTKDKGHVSIHVAGYPTEAGKSMFQSEADFTASFKKWKNHTGAKGPKPKVCGGSGSQMDCVAADLVGIVTASTCDAVGADGRCTAMTPFIPEKVAFRYLNSKDTGSKWILNTAYPSKNSDCQ